MYLFNFVFRHIDRKVWYLYSLIKSMEKLNDNFFANKKTKQFNRKYILKTQV